MIKVLEIKSIKTKIILHFSGYVLKKKCSHRKYFVRHTYEKN